MRSPDRSRGDRGARASHLRDGVVSRPGREDYGRGAWCDITNDATVKQIAAAKDLRRDSSADRRRGIDQAEVVSARREGAPPNLAGPVREGRGLDLSSALSYPP
jgi:hypothetical protein